MYWLWGPGENVLERMMVFPLMKGICWWTSGRRSFGRTTEPWWDGNRLSMLVSLLTCTKRTRRWKAFQKSALTNNWKWEVKTFKTNSSFNSVGDESRKVIQWQYKERLNYSPFYCSSGCIFLCAWRIILRMTVKRLWKMFYRTDFETCRPSFF